jgi:hypothetical protein
VSSDSDISALSAIVREPVVLSALHEGEEEKDEIEDEDEVEELEEEKEEDNTVEKEEPSNCRPKSTAATPLPHIASQAQTATAKNRARRDAEAYPTHKFCTLCSEDILLTNYSYHYSGIFGRYSRCKACRSKSERNRRAEMKIVEEVVEEAQNGEDEEEDQEDEEEEEEEGEEKEAGREEVGHADFQRLTSEERSNEATRRNRVRNNEDACATSKWCRICLRDRPLEDYDKNSASFFGRRSDCQICLTYGVRRVKVQPQIAPRYKPIATRVLCDYNY